MGRIAGKLTLQVKGMRQPVQHAVDRRGSSRRNSGIVFSSKRTSHKAVLINAFGLLWQAFSRAPEPLPLTKYAIAALSSVTAAVMHQPMRPKTVPWRRRPPAKTAIRKSVHLLRPGFQWSSGLRRHSVWYLQHKPAQIVHPSGPGAVQQQIQADAGPCQSIRAVISVIRH